MGEALTPASQAEILLNHKKNMKRFILTGTPGSGKTMILRRLESEGFAVVEEAATDVISLEQAQGCAEPWKDPSFIDKVAELQKLRQVRASHLPDNVQFHDRSVVCTVALARYLGYSLSAKAHHELERIRAEQIFQPRVFFVQNLGRSEERRVGKECRS